MTEKATFAAGCFWGIEAAFRELPGVVDAVSGYEGGQTANPTYRDVCTDRTGHAEAVQIEYNPAEIGYDRLLEVFWDIHDPSMFHVEHTEDLKERFYETNCSSNQPSAYSFQP